MKNALTIFVVAWCIIIIAILAFGTRDQAQAVIEDTTVHHAKWKPADGMLFLPCPVSPRQFPKWKDRQA